MRIIILLTLFLAFPMALAANGADQCRNMNGRGVINEYQEPCLVDTDYDFCFVNRMRGTFNGSMIEYFKYEWLVLLDDLDVPTPPAAEESWYNREFAVLSSKQGMIWGDAQYVFDLRFYDVGGAAIPMIVTGGTGFYEDAYGWITWTLTDSSLFAFSYDGQVCGPNIPNE